MGAPELKKLRSAMSWELQNPQNLTNTLVWELRSPPKSYKNNGSRFPCPKLANTMFGSLAHGFKTLKNWFGELQSLKNLIKTRVWEAQGSKAL